MPTAITIIATIIATILRPVVTTTGTDGGIVTKSAARFESELPAKWRDWRGADCSSRALQAMPLQGVSARQKPPDLQAEGQKFKEPQQLISWNLTSSRKKLIN